MRLVVGVIATTMIPLAMEAQVQPVPIDEWLVPWEASRPRDPYVQDTTKIWFVGQRTSYAAYLDPRTGEFQRFDMDEGTGPHNLIVDSDGVVWYAGNRASHIGRIDPNSGEIEKFPTRSRDPHTLIFDRDENIWFSAQRSNRVGFFNRATGEVTEVDVPTPGARPYGIKLDSRGHPWIALFGTNKLATVDPATMELTEVELPHERTLPRRLVVTPDDHVWYGDYIRGVLGRYNPETGDITEYPLPGGESSLPYGMAVDDQGRIWVAETGLRPNRLVAFDPATESIVSINEIESGGGSIRHMMFHEGSGLLWFGTDTNYVGRAKVGKNAQVDGVS